MKQGWKNRIVGHGTESPDQLLANPQNWRTHPAEQKAALGGILSEVGLVQSVIVNQRTGYILDGHARVELALKANQEQIPVVYVDLSEDEERLVLAVLDPIGAMAGKDDELLRQLLDQVSTDDDGLQALLDSLAGDFDSVDEPQGGLIDDDETPDLRPDPVSRRGDVWVMGDHRLMCGDSTNSDDVSKLMADCVAGMVFTDPPYGVEYQSNMRKRSARFDVLENDDKLLDIAPIISSFSDGWVFVWTSWKVQVGWIDHLSSLGYPTNIIVWHKPGGGIGDLKRTFSSDYEVALVWHRGAQLCGKRIGSVWTISKDAAAKYVHPTQKPVALAEEAIDKTTKAGCVVLDLFGGSGSTLIACQKTNRKARLMELDPKYADVIVRRWQEFTGRSAVLESTGQTFNEVESNTQQVNKAEA